MNTLKRKNTKWSSEEVNQLLTCYKKGYEIENIAEILEKPVPYVESKLSELLSSDETLKKTEIKKEEDEYTKLQQENKLLKQKIKNLKLRQELTHLTNIN